MTFPIFFVRNPEKGLVLALGPQNFTKYTMKEGCHPPECCLFKFLHSSDEVWHPSCSADRVLGRCVDRFLYVAYTLVPVLKVRRVYICSILGTPVSTCYENNTPAAPWWPWNIANRPPWSPGRFCRIGTADLVRWYRCPRHWGTQNATAENWSHHV